MSTKQSYRGSSICGSCQMRRLIRAPITDAPPVDTLIDPAKWRVLREFAAEFDEISAAHRERWEALDFLDWLEPSIITTERYVLSHASMPNFRGTRKGAA